MKTAHSHNPGFTVAEVLVVVIVLTILASAAMLGFNNYIERSRIAEAKEILYKAMAGYQRLIAEGESTNIQNNWSKVGMSDPDALPSPPRSFTYSITSGPPRATARRVGNSSKWVRLDLDTGVLTMGGY